MTRTPDIAMVESPKDAAVDWFLRRGAAPVSAAQAEAEAEAFEAWLARSPDNREAYEEVEIFWAAAAQVESHPRFEARRRSVLRSVDGERLTRRAMAAGLAAAIIGLGGMGLYGLIGPKTLATQSFRTAVGQQATVTLPDGSVVTLNTNTVVRTRADRDRRLIYLDQGQAFFRVAKDRRHPFVVAAAGRTVTALGTAFDVRVDKGALKIVLVEGKVRVESAAAPLRPPAQPGAPAPLAPMTQATEMSAGSQLVAPDDADWRLTRTDVARETSWLHGQIVFDDEALGDIVAELNRYSKRKIVIVDERLALERLSGIYTPGDVQGFSAALKSYGVAEVEEESGEEVRVVALK